MTFESAHMLQFKIKKKKTFQYVFYKSNSNKTIDTCVIKLSFTLTDLFLPKIFVFSGSVFPWRPCYELLMECNCTKKIDKELKYIIFIRIYMYIV